MGQGNLSDRSFKGQGMDLKKNMEADVLERHPFRCSPDKMLLNLLLWVELVVHGRKVSVSQWYVSSGSGRKKQA
jgi:hypothetical protein